LRKKIISIFLILLIPQLLTFPHIKSDFAVEVGQTFVYDIVKSEGEIILGANSANPEGYYIEDQHFNQGTSITINVTNVVPNRVDYTISAGGYSEDRFETFFETTFGFFALAHYPYVVTTFFFGDWNQTQFDRLIGFLLLPFTHNNTETWVDFSEWADDIHVNGTLYPTELSAGLTLDATYTDDGTDYLFELWMTGHKSETLSGLTEFGYVNIDIDHHLQFAFKKATGVQLGLRMVGKAEGTIDGVDYKYSYEMHDELEGYDLPAFTFAIPNGGFISGYEYGITLAALGSIAIIFILVRKRSKRN